MYSRRDFFKTLQKVEFLIQEVHSFLAEVAFQGKP